MEKQFTSQLGRQYTLYIQKIDQVKAPGLTFSFYKESLKFGQPNFRRY